MCFGYMSTKDMLPLTRPTSWTFRAGTGSGATTSFAWLSWNWGSSRSPAWRRGSAPWWRTSSPCDPSKRYCNSLMTLSSNLQNDLSYYSLLTLPPLPAEPRHAAVAERLPAGHGLRDVHGESLAQLLRHDLRSGSRVRETVRQYLF